MTHRVLMACTAAVLAVGSALAGGACERSEAGGEGAVGGSGGEGGCPTGPEALFTITVRAQGPLPADTTVRVTWSAGEEPVFVLGDQETWKTLEEANLVCDVDATKPPPEDLEALICHLWTSGATRVEVSARGFTPYDETLAPTPSEVCDGFIPRDVPIDLVRGQDGGAD